MPKLYMVRHGHAAYQAGPHEMDPQLSFEGRAQAEAVADELSALGPLPLYTSPLRRTRQTAEPLAKRWNTAPRILDGIREVPSPTETFEQRQEWLREFLRMSWPEVKDEVAITWRAEVIRTLRSFTEDSILFTHFVPINVAVGEAKDLARVVNFKPDNCSVTIIETTPHAITVLELGDEATGIIG